MVVVPNEIEIAATATANSYLWNVDKSKKSSQKWSDWTGESGKWKDKSILTLYFGKEKVRDVLDL